MSVQREERLENLRRFAEKWLDSAKSKADTEAMLEALFLMAAADGELSAVEFDQLASVLEYVYPGQSAEEVVQQRVEQLAEGLRTDGWEKRIANMANALKEPELRRNAYRLAAGVSFIDGEIQGDEERLFGLLAEAFAIPSDEASAILHEVRDEIFGD